jgi:hypothetical protein
MSLNEATVVKYTPEHYPRQEGFTCGETNLKGILTGFKLTYIPPQSIRFRIRLFGYSFIQDISDLLETHGLSAPVSSANQLTDPEKIAIIKNHIDNDRSVLLAIGNGYLQRGVYTPIARYFIGHFITIYGYSNEEQVFYIYDPYLKGSYPGDLPVGNDIRSFNELLRDWNGPVYYKLINMDHVYVPVGIDNKE